MQGWDEFDLLELAGTPTAWALAIPVNAEGGWDWNEDPNGFLFPVYGNWDMVSLMGTAIWSPWYNVLATLEGRGRRGETPLHPTTSYGFNPQSDQFVALPDSTLEGDCVRVFNPQSSTSAVVPVGDVGPYNGGGTTSNMWQFNDPYWSPGGSLSNAGPQPPETATGVDLRGRTVGRYAVGTGIDLSYALAQSFGITGNAELMWRFEACGD